MSKIRTAMGVVGVLCLVAGCAVAAETTSPATAAPSAVESKVEDLLNRVGDLERKAKEQEKQPAAVTVATKDSKIKIDGRIFMGAFSTGSDGSFPDATLDIPDAKLRFTATLSPNITIVNRFSNSKAASGGFDYFYADLNNWGGAAPGHTVRIGKFKIDVGQETWSDNPVESILISNSVSHISGYDEGINFRGPLSRNATYSLALMNGNKGVAAADGGLAWAAKIGVAASSQAYLSASYLQTGDLTKPDATLDESDFNIAEVTTAPTGATGWKRRLWEVDAFYGYGSTGIKSVVGSSADPRFQVGAAYGQFTDDAVGAADRAGKYWFVEGLVNASPRIYLASRYSTVSLDGGMTAKLGKSPVAVNEYNRWSIGAGYRLTPLTHLKLEYSRNVTSGGASEPDLDQISLGLAAKF